jgi:hypothetical protein
MNNDHEPAAEAAPPPTPAPMIEEERSVSGAIGTLALGFGLGYTTDLGKAVAHETIETIKDVFTSSDEESPIILPPGVGEDD